MKIHHPACTKKMNKQKLPIELIQLGFFVPMAGLEGVKIKKPN